MKMEIKMIPFINCKCTYLVYLYTKFFADRDYLYYLRNKKFIENKDPLESNNPWVYQPYILGNRDKRSLYLGLKLYFEKMGCFTFQEIYNDKLIRNNKKIIKNNSFLIVDIDEYYFPPSFFFERYHNTHSILVFDINEKWITYLDSEKGFQEIVSLEYFLNAIKKSNSISTIVTVTNKNSNKIKIDNIDYNSLPVSLTGRYIENIAIRFEAYRLMYNFQILPYFELLKMDNLNDKSLCTKITSFLEIIKSYTVLELKDKIRNNFNIQRNQELIEYIDLKYTDIRSCLLNE